MSSQRSPALPFELIEDILGYLYHPKDFGQGQRTLYHCLLTCRALAPRSRYLLFLYPYISSRHAYDCLTLLNRLIPHPDPFLSCTRQLMIMDEGLTKSYAQLFVYRFARQLSSLERLSISNADWVRHTGLHDSFFLSLGLLTKLTTLELHNCRFASSHEFHRMLCALPALSALALSGISWAQDTLQASPHLGNYRSLRLASFIIAENLAVTLTWFLRTAASSSLRALSVLGEVEKDAYSLLNTLLSRLGPSLESLHFSLSGYNPTSPDDELDLENNSRLKSITLRDFPITTVVRLLARVTSSELSMLSVFPVLPAHHSPFDRSGWDTFLDILARPEFRRVERVAITLDIWDYGGNVAKRRCVRRVCQLLPAWLAPLEARGVLWVDIKQDRLAEVDGPYVQGDELAFQKPKSKGGNDKSGRRKHREGGVGHQITIK